MRENYKFRYRAYDEMVKFMYELTKLYPNFIKLIVLQEKYNIQYPKELYCNNKQDTFISCKHYLLHITNHTTNNLYNKPEVFFSGALHGNERIGPNVLIELAYLLGEVTDNKDNKYIQLKKWILYLINNRNIYIIPMTNPYGYYHNVREENNIDPNRDYNYLVSGKSCMRTITGRVLNELWRDHIFQLAITFHGGTRAIGYEWGTPNHKIYGTQKSEISPDNKAQKELVLGLVHFSGSFQTDNQFYPYGTMTDIVYDVTGGMEDWAYAASWENQYTKSGIRPFKPCTPTTYGGYSLTKTVYNNVTHRAFNFLVETSYDKIPDPSTLGNRGELLTNDIEKFSLIPLGHITRNIRLSLFIIDMVEPYVRWIDEDYIHKITVDDDILTKMAYSDCPVLSLQQLNSTSTIFVCSTEDCKISNDTKYVMFIWEILGAYKVDMTYLEISNSKSFDRKSTMKTIKQSGYTRRYYAYINKTFSPSYFIHCINATSIENDIYVRAISSVDSAWGSKDPNSKPNVVPQSHFVNTRTNNRWDMSNGNIVVKGRTDWISDIITLSLKKSSSTPQPFKDEKRGHIKYYEVSIAMLFTIIFFVLVILYCWFKRIRRKKYKYEKFKNASNIHETNEEDEESYGLTEVSSNSSNKEKNDIEIIEK